MYICIILLLFHDLSALDESICSLYHPSYCSSQCLCLLEYSVGSLTTCYHQTPLESMHLEHLNHHLCFSVRVIGMPMQAAGREFAVGASLAELLFMPKTLHQFKGVDWAGLLEGLIRDSTFSITDSLDCLLAVGGFLLT